MSFYLIMSELVEPFLKFFNRNSGRNFQILKTPLSHVLRHIWFTFNEENTVRIQIHYFHFFCHPPVKFDAIFWRFWTRPNVGRLGFLVFRDIQASYLWIDLAESKWIWVGISAFCSFFCLNHFVRSSSYLWLT